MLNFGAAMRAAREQAGLTQAELGQRIGHSRTAVSRLESSADPRLTPRTVHRISQALKTPVSVLMGDAGEREDPVNRRQLLTAAAGAAIASPATQSGAQPAEPGLIGEDEIAEIERGITHLRALDQRNGGDRLGGFALRLVNDAERLLRGRFAPNLAGRLQSTLGEACLLAGWLAQDAGDIPSATRLYSGVITTAHLASDAQLMAHACANLSFVTAAAGQPSLAVQSAQAGLRAAQGRADGVAGPRLRALLAAREATGHARLGHLEPALRAAEQAWRFMESGQGQDPDWVAFVSEGELAGILGDVYSRLGRHDLSIPSLTRAVELPDRPRNATSWRLGLAHAHLAAGDPSQAAAIGSAVLPDVLALSSTRLRDDVTVLTHHLTTHSQITEVRDFRDQATAAGLAA